jgi:ABC-type uncharacterized transport system substrate-binding protein
MKVFIPIFLSVFVLFEPQVTSASDVSALQLLFTVKKVFPQADEVNVLVPSNFFSREEQSIKRASTQTGIQPVIFIIERNSDIGASIRKMGRNSVLIVYGEDLLSERNSKLYVLSKCREKRIALISSSKSYSDSGALLGVLQGADKKVGLVLNLKHNHHLAPHFTPELIAEIGFSQVIE